MLQALRTARGVLRSLWIYYGDRSRRAAMDRLYQQFVQPRDLVFDIGAHVGDRIAAFRRLGCRVVAVEPQPALARLLRCLYGRDHAVVIKQCAIARAPGMTNLMINIDNPTISTASREFIQSAHGARGWEGESWTRSLDVAATSLDALIAEHGLPAFIKIDVEGFEAEALAGLSQPVPALSFEFTTIQRAVGIACIERCAELGYTRFNAALGESQTFVHSAWVDRASLIRWLSDLPYEANSGDIYARRS